MSPPPSEPERISTFSVFLETAKHISEVNIQDNRITFLRNDGQNLTAILEYDNTGLFKIAWSQSLAWEEFDYIAYVDFHNDIENTPSWYVYRYSSTRVDSTNIYLNNDRPTLVRMYAYAPDSGFVSDTYVIPPHSARRLVSIDGTPIYEEEEEVVEKEPKWTFGKQQPDPISTLHERSRSLNSWTFGRSQISVDLVRSRTPQTVLEWSPTRAITSDEETPTDREQTDEQTPDAHFEQSGSEEEFDFSLVHKDDQGNIIIEPREEEDNWEF